MQCFSASASAVRCVYPIARIGTSKFLRAFLVALQSSWQGMMAGRD
jgi:hypothetical protein